MTYSKLSALLLCLAFAKAAKLPSDAVPSSPNPLTLGLFPTPEVQDPIKLKITGEIPTWLSGSLYRGASGTWDRGNYTTEHWFDGFSRNHRFEISNGRVEYRSRNASDELADFVEETGHFPGPSFGGDPCKVMFGAFETTFRDGNHRVGDKSTANVEVSYVANFPGLSSNMSTIHGPFVTLVAVTDGNVLQQLNPTTLEPIELFTYRASNQSLSGARSAAHPAHGSKGEVYNYVLDASARPPEYKVFGIDTKGAGRVLTTIKDAPPAYIHSLFSTANYLILIVWQADFGPTAKPTYNILDSLKAWNPERKTLFYVIDKINGGVVAKYTTEAFFAFHEINSFEDTNTGSIVIDLPTMTNYDFLEASRMKNLREYVGQPNKSSKHDIPGSFRRYRLPQYANAPRHQNGSLIPHPAELEFEIPYDGGNIELARVNPAYHGKSYRYSYGVHIEKKGYFADSIIKIDADTRKAKVWEPKINHMPSEPIFVAHPNGTSEDDGMLLTVALDAKKKLSSLIIIDAKSMTEVARAEMPLVMGYGFHGIWGSV